MSFPLFRYPEDDPVVTFMAEFDGTPLGGEKWKAEHDCIYLDKAMDGCGKNWFTPPLTCRLIT